MGINIKRVLLGGLVAWVVIAVCGFALVPMIGKEMDAVLAGFSLPPLGIGAMIYFAFVSLCVGMFLVWLFAAMLPRFKNRTKTALIAVLIVWVFGYCLHSFSMVAYGFMPMKITFIGTAWGLLELIAGSLIGTRFYKERSES